MAYASITYTSASGTTFALTNSSGDPIEYLRQNDISVTVNGVLKTLTTDYTFNTAGTAIVLNTAVSGATVVIARTTDIADATVSFTAGSTLTAQDLNNSDKQNRFALQEFSDTYGALTTGTGDLSALDGFIGSAETWVSDNAHAPTTGAVDSRVDSKIDTALTTDVVAGDSITVTDNSPSSGQITIGVTNASISTAKLVDSSVTTAKIADGNVTTAKILDANVTTAKILDANVTTAKIADNAVTSAKIADGTIVAADLASDSVTTAKILDSNVTTGKINDLAVTTAKLADSSVTSAKIVDGTIVAGDLASDSVTTAKIVDSNVTTAKINDSAVTTGKIADSAVTAIKIADGVITSAKLNAATVVTAAEQAACTPDDVTFFTTSASDGRYVNVTGDSMTGALAMGSNKITGLGAPTANADAATKQYVDTSVAAGVGDADYGDITVSGTGTVWTIDSGVVTSAKIADGTIVDGDINASAAIALSKLATGALPTAITVASDNIVDGTILNADINAAAAIAGTKISPDFGSQNVTTTGTVTGASLSPTSSTAPTNGVYLPAANTVGISTGGSGRLFVDASGNVGVAVTPSAWRTQNKTIQLGATGVFTAGTSATSLLGIGSNWFLDSGSQIRYIASDFATNYEQSGGNHIWLRAASGTAGANFSWSEQMRLTSTGLGIGTSSPGDKLEVNGNGLFYGNTGSQNGVFVGANSSYNWSIQRENVSTGDLYFGNVSGGSRTTRMTLTDSGRLGIGTTSPAEKFDVRRSGFGNVAFFADDSASGLFIKTASGAAGLDSRNNTTALNFLIDGSEKARLDTSGRWLLGTSTVIGNNTKDAWYAIATFKGRADSNAEDGRIALIRGEGSTSITSGESIGNIFFADQDGGTYASIGSSADGTTGSNDCPGRLTFSTTSDGNFQPTERVRITEAGNFFVFSNGADTVVGGNAAGSGTAQSLFTGVHSRTSTTGGGTVAYRIYNNGTTFSVSDARQKKNVETARDGYLEDLQQLRVVKYNWIDQVDTESKELGLIAQEVAEVFPGLVQSADPSDPESTLGIKSSVFSFMLIKALQEAGEKIEALEARLSALESA